MKLNLTTTVLKIRVALRARTGLVIGTGRAGAFADDTLDVTPDGDLHINGYVWASLVRRAMRRLGGQEEKAERIGKYMPDPEENGLSPLWAEASFIALPLAGIRVGNRMSRQWKAVEAGALFSHEMTPAGLPLGADFNLFCYSHANADSWREALLDAWWVVDQGIETIGAGWSYGFGRLAVQSVSFKILDLTQKAQRELLWRFDELQWDDVVEAAALRRRSPAVTRPWVKLTIPAGLQPGQLMAIRDESPPPEASAFAGPGAVLPDTFVYRQAYVCTGGRLEYLPTVTGKAVRQAVFAKEIERRMRTQGEWTGHRDAAAPDWPVISQPPTCSCRYCQWFGNTGRRGMLSVADSPVDSAECEVLFRSQLCEHSHQNVQLFNGEFLKSGRFELEIIVDGDSPDPRLAQELVAQLSWLLNEMHTDGHAPPGWYRIGGTSAATGQLAILGPVPDIQTMMEQFHE
jgi:hypothetical protein